MCRSRPTIDESQRPGASVPLFIRYQFEPFVLRDAAIDVVRAKATKVLRLFSSFARVLMTCNGILCANVCYSQVVAAHRKTLASSSTSSSSSASPTLSTAEYVSVLSVAIYCLKCAIEIIHFA